MRSSTITSATRNLNTLSLRKLQPISYLHKSPVQQTRKMASGLCRFTTAANNLLTMLTAGSDLGIENTNIQTASGVTLDEHQKTLVGSVLDVRFLTSFACCSG